MAARLESALPDSLKRRTKGLNTVIMKQILKGTKTSIN